MEEKRKIHTDVWLGLTVMALSGFFWSESFKFPVGTGFPRVFLAVFFFMAMILFVLGIIKTVKKISKGNVKLDWKNAIPKAHGVWFIMAGYVIMINIIGFSRLRSLPLLSLCFSTVLEKLKY
jgi:hypothetical protein